MCVRLPLSSSDTGSTELPINRRQEVFSNGSLIIHDVQKSVDDGVYTCHVSNGHETAAENVKITVTGECCKSV